MTDKVSVDAPTGAKGLGDEKSPASVPSDSEALLSALGPIIFKIGSVETQNIKDIFGLLKKFFKVFDSEDKGYIEKKDLGTLRGYGLLSEKGQKRLESYKTEKSGALTFREFATYFVSEILNPSDGKDGKEGEATEVELPDELASQLGPIAVRLMARNDDMVRIFNLFKKLFDVFEPKDGKFPTKNFDVLVSEGVLEEKELKALDTLDPSKSGVLLFDGFLSFWINHFLDEQDKEEDELKSKLGPIIFKIGMVEHQNIKEIFEIVRKVFDVLDEKKSGTVEKKSLSVLKDFGILSENALKRLTTFTTTKDGFVNLKEFVAFFSMEFGKKDIESSGGSDDAIPEKFDKLPPLVFRLSARSDDIQRIFDLFKKLFDVFDFKKKGQISKEELGKLKEHDLLDQKEIENLLAMDSRDKGSVNFDEFLAFWVGHFVESDADKPKSDADKPKDAEKPAATS